ncbi:YbaN family protein [Acidaminobacter sp.]|uniref:YbaN family protein n=1 Tax=Acidaminobacter sp. TaxID=1872102 RepID=UPI0013820B97|nr:YbaN family protein [Acidaminobacter sp.]MDK9711523.1 YbaN family protein [Acidaminobacter sp.]MZQ96364.1 DUF454 family protein [Acidaminobacter sp.]
MSSRLKKHLLILAGSLALILGIIGVVLPVLPTTPFLLLASYCYMRSSKRLYDWLMNHKILGPYLYDYITYRGVRRKARTAALSMLWLTLSISMILVDHFHIRLLLVFIGVAVSIHLFTLKTIESEQPAD